MSTPADDWVRRHHFLLRRLHSLSGIVPVGVFLAVHLYTNSLAGLGHERFDEHVREIHAIPYLGWLETFGIFLPIAFHAGYGVVIARQGRSNVRHYGWLDNWRYTLQRVTAWITLAFILVHLAHFRFAHWFGGPAYQETIAAGTTPTDLTQMGFMHLLSPGTWFVVYSVGLVAAVYHFCNGIATFCITWGVTVGDAARRRVLVASGGLAALLLTWGFMSLWALSLRAAPRVPERRPVAATAFERESGTAAGRHAERSEASGSGRADGARTGG